MKKSLALSVAIHVTVLSIFIMIGAIFIRFFAHSTNDPDIQSTELLEKPDNNYDTTSEKSQSSFQLSSSQDIVGKSSQSNSFSFVVLADSENYKTSSGYNDIFPHMLTVSNKLMPNFALFTGDLITQPEASFARVRMLKQLIEKYYVTYYIAFGKHDMECGTACVNVWQEVFFDRTEKRDLYYSFDYENTHFVLLSSDYPLKHGIDDAQLAWLEEDLKKTNKEHIIVISHVPPVNFYEASAKECHDMTCDESRRAHLQSIMDAHHVDLVISGHEHSFDHKIVNKTHYILAGNIGNGKRYKDTLWQNSFVYLAVEGSRITLKLLDENGALLQEKIIK